ncbi:Vacuolar protein sorting-associated protein 17 [Dinochytrium kinnereticum]|nr:Vacuolar protein sorting-associated protein 17 [Dinochytrium kinnereticum]
MASESPYTLDVSVVGAAKDLNGDIQIVANTDIPTYSRPKYSITRTHAELERLTSYIQNHFPELISPIPPAKTLEITTYVKAVDLFLKRVAENGALRESEGVRLFFDSEFQFTPPAPPPGSKRTSVFNLFAVAAPKVQEVDPFFDNAKAEATGVEANMAVVAKSVEKAGKVERAYATTCVDVCSRLLNLGDEEPEQISSSLKKLAKHFQLLETAYSSQVALNNRVNVLSDYEASCKSTQRKIQVIEKLKASSSIRQDKVDSALEDLTEAKRTEATNRELLKKMGENVKAEYQLYSKRHNEDLLQQLNEYVARQLHYNAQILAVLNDRI